MFHRQLLLSGLTLLESSPLALSFFFLAVWSLHRIRHRCSFSFQVKSWGFDSLLDLLAR